ncbi:hypothetical protein FA95DRAFT_1559339 [Auriscalpium vulgare]|uniref:Uncharacterized protein n=1 Tax=Auriscalpium vulgare TaxID=40419 RepID=A0ACB8RUI4_9AGAM|nr:hypothetical protein FA95DRAFT_1559339 [Auriscalpium vulgare]
MMVDRPRSADELLYHLARAVREVLAVRFSFLPPAIGNADWPMAAQGRADRDLHVAAPPHALALDGLRPEDVTIVGALNLEEGKWFPILRVAHRPTW